MFDLNKKTAQPLFDHAAFKKIADKACLELREFSGRGMYGKCCVAIDCANIDETIAEIIEACGNTNAATYLTQTMKQDITGLAGIIYWQGIVWSEAASNAQSDETGNAELRRYYLWKAEGFARLSDDESKPRNILDVMKYRALALYYRAKAANVPET
jgi:hypothetical protein